jgi:hypothetical protein
VLGIESLPILKKMSMRRAHEEVSHDDGRVFVGLLNNAILGGGINFATRFDEDSIFEKLAF